MEYTVNKVENFNPFDYIETAKDRRGNDIIKADGKPLQYMTTAAKVLWFRKVYPKGILMTEQLETPEKEFGQIVSFRASVLADNDTLLAEWTHQETCWDIAELDNIVARVQTIALGKSLSKAGFGCEVELLLGAMSEGEIPEKPEKEIAEAPKKKRGRPKKTEAAEETTEAAESLESEIETLLTAAEAAVEEKAPAAEEAPEEKDETSTDIEKFLEMELEVTDKAPINIKKMAGMKLKDILADHKDFGALVKTRPNIRNAVSEECAKALIYIEDHKM